MSCTSIKMISNQSKNLSQMTLSLNYKFKMNQQKKFIHFESNWFKSISKKLNQFRYSINEKLKNYQTSIIEIESRWILRCNHI